MTYPYTRKQQDLGFVWSCDKHLPDVGLNRYIDKNDNIFTYRYDYHVYMHKLIKMQSKSIISTENEYLSKKDIEDQGFILHENSGIWSKIACRSKIWSFDKPHEYKLKAIFNWNNCKSALICIWSNIHNPGYNDTIFEGIIKDKHEFGLVLKQVGINE